MSAHRCHGPWLARAGLATGLALSACTKSSPEGVTGPAASASAAPAGLSPELAARVLAKVGDRVITLGDYAAVLERMDRFERLRYQTADRRKQLLDEIIQVELLAREAERRGLGDKPETKELVRQILRDEVLRELREKQPKAEDIAASDVRAYYDAHRDDFREPERRRVAHIVLPTRAAADQVLAQAKTATPAQWGELVKKHSTAQPGQAPHELGGDLGMVTPPGSGKTDNSRVPEPVRAAAFEIPKVGTVLERVVEEGGRFHIVRLMAKNDPRDRSLEEADRTIRVRLVQERLRRAEDDLEKELRARYPVKVDENALAKVPVPAAPPAPSARKNP
jgi:parvulin-like peptidyl-prolyl isomerase